MKTPLTISLLMEEARSFAEMESQHSEPTLFGVTDGKAVGTYLEHKFHKYLHARYEYVEGSSLKRSSAILPPSDTSRFPTPFSGDFSTGGS